MFRKISIAIAACALSMTAIASQPQVQDDSLQHLDSPVTMIEKRIESVNSNISFLESKIKNDTHLPLEISKKMEGTLEREKAKKVELEKTLIEFKQIEANKKAEADKAK